MRLQDEDPPESEPHPDPREKRHDPTVPSPDVERAEKVEIPPGATRETIRVRYGETDQMGHAYYANYLFWFEQARGAFCRDRGFSYRDLEAEGFMLPVVECHVRYRAEVRYDERVEVAVWLSEARRAALRFDYAVTNLETGARATEGHTWHVVMGRERRAVGIPPELRERLGPAMPAPPGS